MWLLGTGPVVAGKFLAALKGRAQKQRRWLWPQDCGTAVIKKGLSMFFPFFPSVDSKEHKPKAKRQI